MTTTDRVALLAREQLTDAADAWVAGSLDPSLLLRGPRLELVEEWLAHDGAATELSLGERQLLTVSRALAATERLDSERRARRGRWRLRGVAAVAVVAVVFSSVASREHHGAAHTRDEALSRQVALEATTLRATDPSLAMQLALVAYRLSDTSQATSALIDTTAGEMPTRLLGPVGPSAIALGDDQHEVAVGYSGSDQVRIFSLRYSQFTWLASVPAGPAATDTYAVALSRNGHLLAVGGTGRQVELWSLSSPRKPKLLATLSAGSGTVYGLGFSPSGAALAAADADGTVRRWSLQTPTHPVAQAELVAPGRRALHAVSYSPSGETVAAAGAGGLLVVWHAHAGVSPVATLAAGATTLTSVAYSPDGGTLAAGARDARVYLWKVAADGTPSTSLAPLSGFAGAVDSVAFSRDGSYLAAGGSGGSARVWSTSTWSETATFPHPAAVTGVAFTDGDRHLVSVDEAGTTRIWQFPPPSTYTEPGGIRSITYTADQTELLAWNGSSGGSIGLWNVTDEWRPSPIASITVPAAARVGVGVGVGVGVEALDPSGQLRAVSDAAGHIHLANVTNPLRPSRLPTLYPAGAGQILDLAFSPDGDLLAAACADHDVWLWDVSDPTDPKLVAKLAGFNRSPDTVTFSSNSEVLFAGSAGHAVRIWDVSDPTDPTPLGEPLTGPTGAVSQIALSPDGQTLAAATTNGQVWLWGIGDPAKPTMRATLTAAAGPLTALAFSPTDNTLVAGGADGRLTVWHYRPYQAVDRICALAGTPITTGEWDQYVQDAPYDPPCAHWTPPATTPAAS